MKIILLFFFILLSPTLLHSGDYYETTGKYLGSDYIQDGKVFIVLAPKQFEAHYFRKGGIYLEQHSSLDWLVRYVGQWRMKSHSYMPYSLNNSKLSRQICREHTITYHS